METNIRKKEYAKKFTIVVVADKQGDYFRDVLKSVYGQIYDQTKYEVIIMNYEGTNVDPEIIEEFRYWYSKNTRVLNIKGKNFGDVLNAIGERKIRFSGEYITFVRSHNTLRNTALSDFDRMNGDIMVMGIEHIDTSNKNQEMFNEVKRKKIKVFLRLPGLNAPERMTTRFSTELGKCYHERLFNDWRPIGSYSSGTSSLLYAIMLSRANEVFYFPRVGGTWRGNKGRYKKSKLTSKQIDDYQKSLQFLLKYKDESTLFNKIVFLNLYELVVAHDGKVPLVEYDLDMQHVDLHNYYVHFPIYHEYMMNKAKKTVQEMREQLGRRIKIK